MGARSWFPVPALLRCSLSWRLITLIHLTPYCYSYQATYLPFHSAHCEYLFGIRSAGNVSISFFLRKGRGRGVHCTLYTEQRGGAWAQFRQKYAVFYALLAHFLLKMNVSFVYRTQKSFFYICYGKKLR